MNDPQTIEMTSTAKGNVVPMAQPAPISITDAGTLIAMIGRMTTDPNVDIVKFERLVATYERIKETEARAAFAAAFAAAKREMGPAIKNVENTQTNSKYADLGAISKAVDEALANHNLTPTFGNDISPVPGCYRVTCELMHSDPERRLSFSKHYQADVPSDLTGPKGNQNKSATHAFGSTMTYGRRYLKCLMFDIAIKGEDDDGNGAGGKAAKEVTVTELQKLYDCIADVDKDLKQRGIATHVDRNKVLEKAGVERFQDIRPRDIAPLINSIRQWSKHQRPAPKQRQPPEDMGEMPDIPDYLRRQR